MAGVPGHNGIYLGLGAAPLHPGKSRYAIVDFKLPDGRRLDGLAHMAALRPLITELADLAKLARGSLGASA